MTETTSPAVRPPWLDVRTCIDGATATVWLDGELDMVSARDLDAVLALLLDEVCGDLVVDVTELAFCGASGLDVLARAAHRTVDRGAVAALRGASPMLRRLLEITGLAGLLAVLDPPEPVCAPSWG